MLSLLEAWGKGGSVSKRPMVGLILNLAPLPGNRSIPERLGPSLAQDTVFLVSTEHGLGINSFPSGTSQSSCSEAIPAGIAVKSLLYIISVC